VNIKIRYKLGRRRLAQRSRERDHERPFRDWIAQPSIDGCGLDWAPPSSGDDGDEIDSIGAIWPLFAKGRSLVNAIFFSEAGDRPMVLEMVGVGSFE